MSKQSHVRSNLRALAMKNDPALLRQIEHIVGPVKNVMWRQGRTENDDRSWTRG